MSEQAGRYQRSAAGMIGAMLVLLFVVVGFVLLREVNRSDPEAPGEPVDYQQTADFARDQADFAILAPPELPDGWRATSVEFVPEPARWHLGLLTDEGEYVGLEQAESAVKSMVTTYVDSDPSRGEAVTIDAQSWSSWTDEGGDTALVRTDGEAVTLVVGPVERGLLVDYVRSLR